MPASSSGSAPAADRRDVAVERRFVAAANRGDVEGIRAVFAPDARFDSVGRIYQGRDEIIGRFLGPEVVDAGGRYRRVATRTEAGRLVIEYEFTTGSGGGERFTYAYLIRDGVITDVIGRYV